MLKATSKEVRLRSRPTGFPQESNFEVASVPVTQPADGEVLVRNIWISVDPYMRSRMTDQESYVPSFQIGQPLQGGAVGQIIESRSPDFVVGEFVFSMMGWRESREAGVSAPPT